MLGKTYQQLKKASSRKRGNESVKTTVKSKRKKNKKRKKIKGSVFDDDYE